MYLIVYEVFKIIGRHDFDSHSLAFILVIERFISAASSFIGFGAMRCDAIVE